MTADRLTSSQQVAWWEVHTVISPLLERVGSWPMAGTPEWCALGDDDPRKFVALLDAAQHHALRVETCQQAECEASRDVSAAADWAGIGRRQLQRERFYTEHPYLKRQRPA